MEHVVPKDRRTFIRHNSWLPEVELIRGSVRLLWSNGDIKWMPLDLPIVIHRLEGSLHRGDFNTVEYRWFDPVQGWVKK
jgi:hypothetical protein